MKRQTNTNRPFEWEDEAPQEPSFRRVREGVPPSGRNLPGMPLQMADPDDAYPSGAAPFSAPRNPWWRPANTAGRVFLALGALLVIGSFVTAGLALKTYLERDARFRIAGTEQHSAAGLTEVSAPRCSPSSAKTSGAISFLSRSAERRKELEEIPWVERATVMRVLPDQIRVALVERQPVAFTRQGQQIGLVDANGVLLSHARGHDGPASLFFPGR